MRSQSLDSDWLCRHAFIISMMGFKPLRPHVDSIANAEVLEYAALESNIIWRSLLQAFAIEKNIQFDSHALCLEHQRNKQEAEHRKPSIFKRYRGCTGY